MAAIPFTSHAEDRAARYALDLAVKLVSGFCRLGNSFLPPSFYKLTSAVTVQKMPAISIAVIRRPWRQCSSVKSSRKVNRVACGLPGVISEQSDLGTIPIFLDQCWLFPGSVDIRLRVSCFWARLIAAPVARMHPIVIVWGKAGKCQRRGMKNYLYIEHTPATVRVPIISCRLEDPRVPRPTMNALRGL